MVLSTGVKIKVDRFGLDRKKKIKLHLKGHTSLKYGLPLLLSGSNVLSFKGLFPVSKERGTFGFVDADETVCEVVEPAPGGETYWSRVEGNITMCVIDTRDGLDMWVPFELC